MEPVSSLLGFTLLFGPKKPVILGLTRLARREKVECEEYGPLGDQAKGPHEGRITCEPLTTVCASVVFTFEDKFEF